jgi:SAM-dependent methyltransferase
MLNENSWVLEVGSGACPWPRSDVLLDRYFLDPDGQRSYNGIHVDGRPLILAAGERLPFESKSFDFIYCSHVIEHALDLSSMIGELSRVGKSGYIECPNFLFERYLDQGQHRWYLFLDEKKAIHACRKTLENNFSRKWDWTIFQILNQSHLIKEKWKLFTIQLHWEGKVELIIHNDLESFLKQAQQSNIWSEIQYKNCSLVTEMKDIFTKRLYNWIKYFDKKIPDIGLKSLYIRIKKIKLTQKSFRHSREKFIGKMRCPLDGGALEGVFSDGKLNACRCRLCQVIYSINDNVYDMMPQKLND